MYVGFEPTIFAQHSDDLLSLGFRREDENLILNVYARVNGQVFNLYKYYRTSIIIISFSNLSYHKVFSQLRDNQTEIRRQ